VLRAEIEAREPPLKTEFQQKQLSIEQSGQEEDVQQCKKAQTISMAFTDWGIDRSDGEPRRSILTIKGQAFVTSIMSAELIASASNTAKDQASRQGTTRPSRKAAKKAAAATTA